MPTKKKNSILVIGRFRNFKNSEPISLITTLTPGQLQEYALQTETMPNQFRDENVVLGKDLVYPGGTVFGAIHNQITIFPFHRFYPGQDGKYGYGWLNLGLVHFYLKLLAL